MNVIRRIGLKNLVRLGLINTRPLLINSLVNYSSKLAKNEDMKNPKTQQFKDPRKQSPKITLINTDESITIVALDEAQHISKRRNLKLVHVMDMDVKTLRPVYK